MFRAGLTDDRVTGTAAAKRGFLTWARSIWLENERLSFRRFPWLVDIYDDRSPRICARKCTQTGFTVWAVLRALFGLQTLYRSVLYYMPTGKDVKDFVQTRVDPIIQDNASLKMLCRGTNNTNVKRVGSGNLYFRGMVSKSGLKSTPADCVVFDEFDEMKPAAVKAGQKRMAASPIKHEVDIGNPTFPDYGISRVYDESDQRMWHLRCPGCSKWACPDQGLPGALGDDVPCVERLPKGGARLVCEHCQATLDANAEGRWIPMKPGAGRIPGYGLSQVNRPGMDLVGFLDEYEKCTEPQPLFNLGFGVPYIDARNRVTADQVLACCGSKQMATGSDTPTTMGIDTGKDFHWVVSRPGEARRREYLAAGIAGGYGELDDVIARFRVYRFVVDAMPEIHSTKKWVKAKHPGRGFRCFFNEHQRGSPKWDEGERMVTLNRTEALDASRDLVRGQEVVYPAESPTMVLFATHYQNDAKRLIEDAETGSRKYLYIKLKPADHFSLAATYDAMVWQWGGGPTTGSSSLGGANTWSSRRRPSPIPGARRR